MRKIILKLIGGNTIIPINLRVLSLIRYGAGILNRTKDELATLETLPMNRIYHTQSDVGRLSYGEKGLLSIRDSVEIESICFGKYTEISNEKLFAFLRNEFYQNERESVILESKAHHNMLEDTEEVTRDALWNKKTH